MNLADAIRKAANRGLIDEPAPPVPPKPVRIGTPQSPSEVSITETAMKNLNEFHETQSPAPEPLSAGLVGGNAVRLEIFLSGEQMAGMLKAIMAGQHSVLTLREAASYLRLSPSKLERLVDDGEIPAVELDGRYRFPKSNLDDWLAMQSIQSEDEQDVA
ncbi:MAG TPA: helix-turn-helix domain-containing protein [Fimbriimonadaceae bacterium]|nr:helix-turn-helix domain-containing protein [Fimbriimonadaceae bacterium]